MAISLLATTSAGTRHYACLSADIPLLPATGPALSTAVVTDSPGLIVIWDGDDWAQHSMLSGVDGTSVLRATALMAHSQNEQALRMASALSGDMALRVSPSTTASLATVVVAAIAGDDEKYVRTVTVELVDSDGNVHTWFNGSFAVAGSEVTAGDGTADTAAATVQLAAGVGTCELEYVGTWAAEDTATITVTGGTLLGFSIADATSVDTLATE